MLLHLFKKYCPEAAPNTLYSFLGNGWDGEVWEISDSKVIKFSALYDTDEECIRRSFQNKEKIFEKLLYNLPNCFGNVFFFQKHFEGIISDMILPHPDMPCILYSYVMEKLYPITEDEKKVFHTIVSHEDRNAIKKFSRGALKETLSGLSKGLDFDEQRIIFFYDNLQNSPLKHQDVCPRNIMKTCQGDFKLIDFDRITLEN